mmetsp:Transcript_1162/g.2484  ORF Transcript_1162/g.2484 Transcript_1162/m.2484 type:complete len:303 (+) Transcript_1162:2658-3566(+)
MRKTAKQQVLGGATLTLHRGRFTDVHVQVAVDSRETSQVVVLQAGKFKQVSHGRAFTTVELIFREVLGRVERVVRRQLQVGVRENVYKLDAESFKAGLVRSDEGFHVGGQRRIRSLLAHGDVKNVHLLTRNTSIGDGLFKTIQDGGESCLGFSQVFDASQKTASERALIWVRVELEVPANGGHAIVTRNVGADDVVSTIDTLGVDFERSILDGFILVREERREEIDGERRRLNQGLEVTGLCLAPSAAQTLRTHKNLSEFFQALIDRRQTALKQNIGCFKRNIAVFGTAKLGQLLDALAERI